MLFSLRFVHFLSSILRKDGVGRRVFGLGRFLGIRVAGRESQTTKSELALRIEFIYLSDCTSLRQHCALSVQSL